MSHGTMKSTGRGPISVPPEVWLIIADAIRPNPYSYVRLAAICRSSRAVFLSDRVWRKVFPHAGITGNYCYQLDKILSKKGKKMRRLIYFNWKTPLAEKRAMLRSLQRTPSKQQDGLKRSIYDDFVGTRDPDLYLSLFNGGEFEFRNLAAKLKFHEQTFSTEFWQCVLLQDPLQFENSPRQFKHDPELVLFALQNKCSPAFLPKGAKVLKDLRVARVAVKRMPTIIWEMNTPFLAKNIDLVLDAVKLDPWVIVRPEVKIFCDNEAIAFEAVKNAGQLLGVLPNQLQGDYTIVKAAVNVYGAALQHASAPLQDQKDIVLAAVTNCGLALKFASSGLKRDKEIVLAAVRSNADARRFASLELQADPDVIAATLMSMRTHS